ncbi:hypothetical protein CHLRE_14g627150v5 [Chlamydomonas reinhardtii]|uniref:NFACT RNA-binding domain-containing protein n=1 Tax=Chlamydomonas reinhardtii TaxID=3055 RepID=A0A2K3CYE6_CHLRE|nr:uncharacterized protein CHLRE_14g627150v5 [Chlamydomonas reinhardtii]XP_042916973.1 uncharacterized protein CHLRE_14g627150v5 [Chlamydomonas reinhardtii]PNW73302.1 hypothetical protein CHLRE_14g627150v5 [Chlamydomonas reinhardtii]PNW73303.1 hypothetical protein CHLRE_14g627150v5 [Chlamydomonas reinhardtii]
MQIQALGSLHQQTASGHAYSGWPTRVARRAVSRAAPWGTSASRPLASGVYGAQTAAAASSATTTALVGSGAAVSSAWASSRPTVMRYPCTPSSTPQRPARLPASGAGATWAGLPSTPAVSVGAPGLSPALCNRRRAAGIAGLGSLSGGQRRPALATAAAAAASAPAALAGAGGGAGARAIRSDSDAGDASSDSVPVVSGNSVGSSTGTGVKLQPVDYSTLAAAVAELRAGWVPAKVEQVLMPDKTSLCLRLRTPAGQGWLRLCWHAASGRLAMLDPRDGPERGSATELYSLAEQVHSALTGLVLVGVELPAAWERVAALRFGTRPGEPPSHSLYLEIMARYSNLVLAGSQNEILATAYQVGGMMSSHRQVQVGRSYSLPPLLFGVPPSPAATAAAAAEWRQTLTRAAAMAAATAAATAAARQQRKKGAGGGGGSAAAAAAAAAPPEDASRDPAVAADSANTVIAVAGVAGEGRLMDGFVRAFHGVSPALVEELCVAAGVPGAAAAPPSSLSEGQWAALHGQWLAWQRRLAAGEFAASSDPATGRYSVFGSLPVRHASVHALLEQYYGPAAAAEAAAALQARLAGVVAAALKKTRGKVRAFQQQLSDSDAAEGVQRQADLITANLYRIPAGASSVTVEDWDTGAPLTLPLDPLQPPVATAEGLYKKARKLRRAVDAVGPLLAAAEEEVAYLEEVEVGLAGLKQWSGDAADMAALREVQDELVAGKYMKPPTDAALAVKTAAKAAKAAQRNATRSGGGGGKKGASGGAGKKSTAAGAAGGGGGGAAAAAAAAGGGGDTAAARRYTSPGGYTVLVGRNNKQNDVLSTQVAADEDLWFHVRGMPGSHVLLRTAAGASPRGAGGGGSSGGRQGPQQPSDADVQFAADCAAFFSKAKDSIKVDVVMSKGAWVRKPRGAKPGAVQVTRELGNVVGRPGGCPAAALEST